MMTRAGMKQTPLVGREAELGQIWLLLESARRARGGVILVSGEAGIGKTRLCREVLAEATKKSMQTLVGRAYPEDAEMELGPVVDSLRTGRRRPESTVWRCAALRSHFLATILPELADASAPPSAPTNRSLLFETLLDVVNDVADSHGLVWVLEDLHWADPVSWEFVFYTARRIASIPLALLVTMREEDVHVDNPWTQRLAGLRREDDVVEVRLHPLTKAETEKMVRSIAGPGQGADVAERIAARSEGIPLLAEELVAVQGQTAGAELQVPDIVRATLRQRKLILDPDAQEVLELIAVMGPQITVDVVFQLRPDGAHERIQRLIDAGLLVIGSDLPPEQLSFRHALIREAEYADIPWARRRQLHAEIAQVLASAATLEPVERIARHWALAGHVDTALNVLVAGADRARTSGNIGRAASLGLAALDLADKHPQFASMRVDLKLPVLGDLFRAGRWTELTPLARAAWAQRRTELGSERGWIANMLGLSLFYSGAADDAAALVNREVARLRGSDDAGGAAFLISTAACIAAFRGETDDAIRLSEVASEYARGSGEAEAEHRARNVLILARSRRDRDREAAARSHRQNAEFAHAAGLTVAEANSWWNYAHMTADLDDYLRAEHAAEQAGTWYASVSRLMQGMVHLLEGRPSEADQLFNQVRSEIRLGIPMMSGVMDASDAHLLLHDGRVAEARQALSRMPQDHMEADLPQWRAVWAAARGWLAWEEADLESAERAFQVSQECCAAVGYHAFELGPIFVPLHVDVLCRMEQAERAARVIDEAAAVHRVPDRFFRASLAAARFRLHPTEQSAAEAIATARAAPWPWLEALVACWCGELLEDVQVAEAAREQFASIGAQRGIERATAVLRRLGAPTGVRHVATRGDKLSSREWEVAQLVADGLTNAAIAERLFLSRPTVASHVANILAKLRFGSRAQVAAWVADQRRAEAEAPRQSS